MTTQTLTTDPTLTQTLPVIVRSQEMFKEQNEYLGIPEEIPLPLYHTKLVPNSRPEMPMTVTIDVALVLQRIQKNRLKAFRRSSKIKRNRLLIKLGWMPEPLWNELVVSKLKTIVKPRYRELIRRKIHHVWIFNMVFLEFLLGDKWWVQMIPLKGTKEVDGYVLVNDLCGIRMSWSQNTEALRIMVPIRYVNHAGYRQFG
eukprot:TRINITY_DN7103_c0_g2_i1.p1 TRINITY_DN7103_c0_g2~~TRINITY_DN7103_c0_g2_i1.p1  ORF type:complete len:200 (+),score=-1.32 TRINITY_DN7103_c0_g2_i1:192-791(+)